VIQVMTALLDKVGIKGYEVRINNLGCAEDKKRLSGILKDIFLEKTVAKALCEDCHRRAKENPLRLLDCKNESCRAIIKSRFKEVKFLCADCEKFFEDVMNYLKIAKVNFLIDPYIVRGLDYYTRTVFEVIHPSLGSQNAIGAGGRYDNLVSQMGGPETGACGFALGVDRMVLTIPSETTKVKKGSELDLLYIAALGDAAHTKGFEILADLRSSGIASAMTYEDSSLKSQMRFADTMNADFTLIIGDDEIAKGEAILRNMHTKEQESVGFDNLTEVIKKKIGKHVKNAYLR